MRTINWYYLPIILLLLSFFGCEKESEISFQQEITSDDSEIQDPFINEKEIKNFFSDDYLVKNNRFRTSYQTGRSDGQINDLIEILKNDLGKDEESLMNVQSLINSLGYIDWSNYSYYQGEMGEQVSFPVYKEHSSKVNGVFMFYVTDLDVNYFLTHRNKINSYLHVDNWRSEYRNLYFSVLDLWDFDLIVFDNENKNLLKWLNENDPNENNSRITSTGRNIECYTVWRCGSCPPPDHAARNEEVSTRDWYECCSPTTYCDTYEPYIPPVSGGGSGDGGSGGSDGSDDEVTMEEDGICPSTFDFKAIGTGFTTEVTNIKFSMFHTGVDRALLVYIGTLCIQVRQMDANGVGISMEFAAALTAEAWGNAQYYINNKFKINPLTYTSFQGKTDFLNEFRSELQRLFGGLPAVANGPCGGDIPTNTPSYSIFCWN